MRRDQRKDRWRATPDDTGQRPQTPICYPTRYPQTRATELLPRVDGTFIWTPNHDQRPRSFATAVRRGYNRCRPGAAGGVECPKRRVWTNDLDGRRSLTLPAGNDQELPGDSPHGHGMWLRRRTTAAPRRDCESPVTGLDRNEIGALLVAAGLGPAAEHALISL